jgi:hypothetical protein
MRLRLGYAAAAALPILILSSCLLPSFDNVPGSGAGGTSSYGGSGGASPEAGSGAESGAVGEAGAAGSNGVAPMPVADVFSMLQGATLTVPAPGVLENDVGSSLVVDAVDDSDPTRPKKYDATGLSIDADGTLKFEPQADFFGTYSMVYTVRDKDGVTAQASVKINVQPVNASLATVRDGVGGFVIDGADSDAIGGAVAAAGDVNGDGFDDILIGAPAAGNAGAGRAYVVYGRATPANITLEALPATSTERTFFELDGVAGDGAGNSVAGIGDINGDKVSDFAVAASQGNGGLGSVYVVFGGALSGALALGALSATQGATLTGKSVAIGKLISHGGDVNDDGIPDLLVSGASSPLQNGRVFVVLGTKTPKSADIDDVPGLFVIQSDAANDLLPESLDYVGNVDNADGDEIAMTSRSSVIMVRGTTRGGTYPSTTGPLSGSGNTGGGWSYMLQNQLVTAAVAGAGDVDGDPPHSADLLICEADMSGKMACRVVLGPPTTLSAGWNLVGFKELPYLAHGADINGDGHSDLLFGEASKVYAVFGKQLPLPDVDVTALGDAGFTLNTEGSERVDSVTTLGDVNGDGALDYAVGVSSASQGAGSVYVVFGSTSGG